MTEMWVKVDEILETQHFTFNKSAQYEITYTNFPFERVKFSFKNKSIFIQSDRT